MTDLCAGTASWDCITCDIGDNETAHEIWTKARYAKTMTAGFSCQPFSKLGDGLGRNDPRSSCLTKVLQAAHLLQTQILVLGCVLPAASNEFVQSEIKKFQQLTGFNCKQINLKLQDIWPTRRDRAWWILSSPALSPIDAKSWTELPELPAVECVIPKIFPWDPKDETALQLDDIEASAFGLNDDTFHKT